MNALVFDNSVMVLTKNNMEYFFTSFVFRDVAIEMLSNYLDGGPGDKSRTNSQDKKQMEEVEENKQE